MMGIILNLLLSFLEEKKGKEVAAKVKKEAGFEEIKSEKHYTAEQWQTLLKAVLDEFGVDAETGQILFAQWVVTPVLDKFGSFFRASKSTLDLLERVPKIHLDLAASSGVKIEEKLKLVERTSDSITIHYESPNKMCIFLKELAKVAFGYYGEKCEITESKCMDKGDSYCEITFKLV